MSITPQPRKIAIVGASGALGTPLLAALQRICPSHTITAVQRPSSTSSFPSSIRVVSGDLTSVSFLTSAFREQNVVVLMPPLPHILSIQEPAARAAASVGVPYVFPAEFGPDPFADALITQNELLQNKKKIRNLIEELGVSSWVSLAVGPWAEFGIGKGLFGVDAQKRTATLWTGADGRANSASVGYTGEALAAVLSLPEEDLVKVKNKAVYAPSLRFSQKELLEAAKRATKGEWTVEEKNVEDVRKEYEGGLKRGEDAAGALKFFVTHMMEGSGADFEDKIDADLRNKLTLLGLKGEKLEDVIRGTME